MARKRRNSSSSESEDLPSPKRARPFSIGDSDLEFEPTTHEEARVHPIYGQRSAFPGLEDNNRGDELFYGPASNGLEYLRMVRSEAKGVPHILVDPNRVLRSEEETGYGEEDVEGGFFEDGAFIAAPQSGSSVAKANDTPPDAQEAYYKSLISRFQHLRTYIQQAPPLSAIASLSSDHPISLPPESDKAKQQWRLLFQRQEPQSTQVACMDMETIIEMVKLLKNLLAVTVRSRSRERINRLGLWIWSVLGKCSEAGQLGSEEVSELRELGKRAVGLLVGIRDRSGENYGHQDNDGEEVVEEEANVGRAGDSAAVKGTTRSATTDKGAPPHPELEMSDLELAKVLLAKQLNEDLRPVENGRLSEMGNLQEDDETEISVDKQIRGMLDMIITIIGELYGQRDLLEFRDIWDDEPGSGLLEDEEK